MIKDHQFKVALADDDAFPHYEIQIEQRGRNATILPIYMVEKRDADALKKILEEFLSGKNFLL
jgi:hypothetical protein